MSHDPTSDLDESARMPTDQQTLGRLDALNAVHPIHRLRARRLAGVEHEARYAPGNLVEYIESLGYSAFTYGPNPGEIEIISHGDRDVTIVVDHYTRRNSSFAYALAFLARRERFGTHDEISTSSRNIVSLRDLYDEYTNAYAEVLLDVFPE